MSKTYADLREASGELLRGYLPDSGKQFIRKYLAKISSTGQPNLVKGLQLVEDGIRNLGYTLGMDFTGNSMEISPDAGDEDFFLYEYATGDLVVTAYLNITWQKGSNASYNKNPAYDGTYGIATPLEFVVTLIDADVDAIKKLTSIPPEDEMDLDIDG